MSLDYLEEKLEFARSNKEIFNERKILDKGFVRLVDWMGSDASIARAARVSYAKGTKTVRDDANLVDYLIRHEHTSPIEMVEFVFHIKLPIAIMAQLVRHRTSSLNQISARYSVVEDEFYIPDKLRSQSNTNKQGSDESEFENEKFLMNMFNRIARDSYDEYRIMLELGVAREVARFVLPQNVYTQVYWKQDLKNLLHLLRLRLDSHAQQEIREVAGGIYDIIKTIVPNTINSWENHTLYSTKLSEDEKQVLQMVSSGSDIEAVLNNMGELSKGRKLEIKNKISELLGR